MDELVPMEIQSSSEFIEIELPMPCILNRFQYFRCYLKIIHRLKLRQLTEIKVLWLTEKFSQTSEKEEF